MLTDIYDDGPKSWMEDKGFGGNNMTFRTHRYGPDYPGLAGRELKPKGQIAEDIKEGWKPIVDLTGATQPGVKLWKKI